MPIASDMYYSLHQRAERETPPVVLIHGAGGDHLHWPSEIRRLPHHRIFALDLPGHGKSGGRGQQSIPSYAGSVIEWLESLSLPRAVFVGHSMGAAIAMHLAIAHPSHVAGLGLIGAGARIPVPGDLLADALNPTTFYKAVDTLAELAYSPAASPRQVELASSRMKEIRPSVLHGDFLACDAFDATGQLGQIDAPTLVLCGADDRFTPPRYAQLLAGLIPGARLEIVFQAGHMVMLEQPQTVASLLAQFLDSITYIAGQGNNRR